MIPHEIATCLKKHAFITVATCDLFNKPNASPKFLLSVENNYIYLVDYVISKTWRNIKENSQISISVIDMNTLVGYQLIGIAEILKRGKERKKMKDVLNRKIMDLSIDRVISAVKSGFKSEGYEISMPVRVVIFKVDVKEIVIISPTGRVKCEKIGKAKVVLRKPVLETTVPTVTVPLLVPSTLEEVKQEIEIIDKK